MTIQSLMYSEHKHFLHTDWFQCQITSLLSIVEIDFAMHSTSRCAKISILVLCKHYLRPILAPIVEIAVDVSDLSH